MVSNSILTTENDILDAETPLWSKNEKNQRNIVFMLKSTKKSTD